MVKLITMACVPLQERVVGLEDLRASQSVLVPSIIQAVLRSSPVSSSVISTLIAVSGAQRLPAWALKGEAKVPILDRQRCFDEGFDLHVVFAPQTGGSPRE